LEKIFFKLLDKAPIGKYLCTKKAFIVSYTEVVYFTFVRFVSGKPTQSNLTKIYQKGALRDENMENSVIVGPKVFCVLTGTFNREF
jgi:hypothetical protein